MWALGAVCVYFAGVCHGVEPVYARAPLAHPLHAQPPQIAITEPGHPPSDQRRREGGCTEHPHLLTPSD